MNKKPNSKSKYLYIGMIFYVLIFFSGSGFIGHIMSAKAAPSSQLIPADTGTPDTTTPVPTTPIDTTTPVPTTPAVTVTAAATTPASQPTTPATQPTPPATKPTTPPVMLPPGGAGPTNNPGVTATATPSATATGTATATPTAVTKPSGTTPTSLTQNTTNNAPPSNPDAGSNAGGSNMLGLSLGIGTPVLLLFGGGLFWLYLRRRQQGVTGPQFGSSTNSSWISSNDMATNNNFSPVLGSFASNSSTLPTPYTTNPLLSSSAGLTSVANTLQQTTLPPFAELAGPLYTPSDLRPITMALPQPFHNQAAPDATPYPPTSDMNPLSFEALNLPQNIAEMMAPQQRPNIADILTPQTPEIPISTTTTNDPLPNPIQISPAPTVAVQPPDPANNAMLENVMRQAQLGLFVVPNP